MEISDKAETIEKRVCDLWSQAEDLTEDERAYNGATKAQTKIYLKPYLRRKQQGGLIIVY